MVITPKHWFIVACAALISLLLMFGFGRSAHGRDGSTESIQVAKGRAVYAEHCAMCHGAALVGNYAPALAGPTFAEQLDIYPLTARQLYEFVTSRMPYGRPGQLSDAEYLAVFSFVLHLNGYPLDDNPLTKDRLKAIPMVPHPLSGATPKYP